MKTTSTNHFQLSLRAAACALAATLGATMYAASVDTPSTSTTTAGNATAETHHGGSMLKHADHRFVEKATEAGREEVEISKIAVERSTNPDVKKLAQMMVDDHTRANEELASIASAKGVTVKEKEKSENKWAKKDAKDFDRDYVKKMISDHKDAIDLFSNESKNGADSDLVDFARKTLPKLQQHLEHVNELKNTVK